jgi:TonB family protein
MKKQFRRYLVASTATHLSIIVLLLVGSLLFHFRKKPKPHEIIAIMDVPAFSPDPSVMQPVEKVEVPPPPEEPRDIPEQKPKPKLKKTEEIKRSTRKVQRTAPPPPRSEKKLSPEEIKRMLAAGLKPADTTRAQTSDFPFDWYLAMVRQKMYAVWIQPSDLSSAAGLVTVVSIRVHRDGSVTDRRMVESSGNSVMDASVMTAVKGVTRLERLPPKFSGAYKDIAVEFELTGAALP